MNETGWASTRLEEVATKVGSGSTPRGGNASYKDSGIPLIRSMNVVFFGFKKDGLAFLDEQQARALDNVTVEAGDVLLNITGASIGRVTIAPDEMDGARVNQHVCIIRPRSGLDARFLNAFLSSPSMQGLIFGENYGVTRQALTKQQILDFKVPIPPLPEQKRIADKLEAVLGRVDTCRARLARVPDLLKRFRQSVLAAATSGRLTEDWRETKNGSPKLAWSKTQLGKACAAVSDGDHQAPPQRPTGIPFLTIGNISSGYLDFSTTRFVDRDYFERIKPDRIPREGDILYSVVGASIGIAVRVDEDRPFCFQRHIAILKPSDRILSQFLLHLLNSPEIFRESWSRISGTAQPTLSLGKLRTIEIELPPLPEQQEIIRRVEALFAFADRIESRFIKSLTTVDRLTPSTLAKAFRGELVPQEPNDEPASTLLARIRAERNAAPQPKHRGRRAAVS